MANRAVLLGDIIELSKSSDILAISDRTKIIRYIERAIEIASFKANWNRFLGTLDICSDSCGCLTLPSFVDTVLAVNINGHPSTPRNGWYEFHINGLGSRENVIGQSLNFVWDDKGWSPVIQDLTEWSCVAAVVEDPLDGDGTKTIQVFGETVDGNYNSKMALTVPVVGDSEPGVKIPMMVGYASTDPQITKFKRITRVIKPVTRGYVKLIGFGPNQLGNAVTLGYYAPNETQPAYRRLKVGKPCTWCRVRYRRLDEPLKNDYDVIPLPSTQSVLDLIKAVRLRETNNIDVAEQYEIKALQLLNDIQQIEDGPGQLQIQVEPGFGMGTIDFR